MCIVATAKYMLNVQSIIITSCVVIPDKVEERVDTAEDCEWDKLNSTRDQEDTSDFVGDSKIKVHLQAP